jgi:O-antigen/teichoic acid export membrane protein
MPSLFASKSGALVRRHFAFLFRDSAIYGVATALNRVVKILLVPIVAKAYSTEVYGAFDSLNVYLYVAGVLGVLGLSSSVVITATMGGRASSPANLRDPATTSFRLVVLASVLLALGICGGSRVLSLILLGSSRYAGIVIWAALSIPFSAILLFTLSLLQWSFRRTWYIGIALGAAALTIGLTYEAVRLDYGLSGFFIANLIGQALGAAAAMFATRDLIAGRWRPEEVKRLLTIGLPFAIIGVASSLLPSIDRIFLVQFHSLDTAGIYGLGQKIATLATLVLAGFQAAWGPFAFARRGDPGESRLFATVFLLVTTLVAVLAVLLTALSPWIARVVATSAYDGSPAYVGPLTLSAGLAIVFGVIAIGSVMEGHSLNNLYAYVAGIGVTLLANVVLAVLGAPAVGIAWANLFGQLAALGLIAWLSHKVHPIPYPYWRAAVVLGIAILAIAGLGGRVSDMSVGGRTAVITVAVVVTIAWLWAAVLSPAQRGSVMRLGRRSLGRVAGRQ